MPKPTNKNHANAIKPIYFDDIVAEFSAALTSEFGIEIDPDAYRESRSENDLSSEVSGIQNDLHQYAEQFLMKQLQHALPRKGFRVDNDQVDDIVMGIAEDLRRIAGIDDSSEIPGYSTDKKAGCNVAIQQHETLDQTVERVGKALKNAEKMIVNPEMSLHI